MNKRAALAKRDHERRREHEAQGRTWRAKRILANKMGIHRLEITPMTPLVVAEKSRPKTTSFIDFSRQQTMPSKPKVRPHTKYKRPQSASCNNVDRQRMKPQRPQTGRQRRRSTPRQRAATPRRTAQDLRPPKRIPIRWEW